MDIKHQEPTDAGAEKWLKKTVEGLFWNGKGNNQSLRMF